MFTNEEMEILNRSIEILSKYVDSGAFPRECLTEFENMIISSIDSVERGTEKSLDVCKYFTEDSHIFRVQNASITSSDGSVAELGINTKYLIFSYSTEDEKFRNHIHNLIYGYKYFHIWYQSIGNMVDLRVGLNSKNTIPDRLFSICFDDEHTHNEFIELLEYAKSGNTRFQYPFDDSIIPEQNIVNGAQTWMLYFSSAVVQPCVFYGSYIKHSENGVEIEHEVIERCMVKLNLGDEISYDKAIGENWEYQSLNVEVKALDGKYSGSMVCRLSELRWSVYLCRESNSVFVGDTYDYEQFVIEDLNELQNVYNYLASLVSQQNLLCLE